MENSRHAQLTPEIDRSVDITYISEFNPTVDSKVEFLPIAGTEMPSTLALLSPWLGPLTIFSSV